MKTIESQFEIKELKEFENYTFAEYSTFSDDVISLELSATLPLDPEKEFLPRYLFNIVVEGAVVGFLVFRAGLTEFSRRYGGHIGYAIDDQFQGNGYASRAVALLRRFIYSTGMSQILVTCDDDNIASRKTIENAGGVLHSIAKEFSVSGQNKTINCCYYTIQCA